MPCDRENSKVFLCHMMTLIMQTKELNLCQYLLLSFIFCRSNNAHHFDFPRCDGLGCDVRRVFHTLCTILLAVVPSFLIRHIVWYSVHDTGSSYNHIIMVSHAYDDGEIHCSLVSHESECVVHTNHRP